MRRKELEVNEGTELEQFLDEMSFGFLSTVKEDGSPSITPLNYVYLNGTIYFHGSWIGEKMKSIAGDARVSFCVAKEYAIIPSYLSDPVLACPATAFFKSVLITGKAAVVKDANEKAEALQALMVKLQPEGGYEPIAAEKDMYRGRLKGVAVVKIEQQQITGKFKFGQGNSEQKLRPLIEGLQQRGKEDDLETIELMHRYCPHLSQSSTESQDS